LSVGLLAMLYLWVFPYHAQVNNPNENVRVYMTVSIVDDHTFAINRLHEQYDWGYVNDKAVRNGRLYSSKAPGTSYLGVPAYWLLTRITGRNTRPLTAAQYRAHHAPMLERTRIIYFLRLWSNVLPALVFAWFWHRFLGRYTSIPALREAVFFSTMAGSLIFAYSEMYASHSQNAICAMGALMAIETTRRRDREGYTTPAIRSWSLVPMFFAGMLGAGATMFEYPAAIATAAVALFILSMSAEKRPVFLLASMPLAAIAAKLFVRHHRPAAVAVFLLAAASYGMTLSWRSAARLVVAGIGGSVPTFLTLYYHKRCFGSPWKPGYSYLENPQFHAETSQGFFGATHFSWESGVRLWLDPAFGLMPMTVIFLAGFAGFGAMLSWRPPVEGKWKSHATWAVRGVLGLICVFVMAKCMAAIPVIRAANWQGPRIAEASWVAWMALALIALASVSLPRPTRGDAALAATMMLSCIGLSRLIGAMNNWRGGWQVGPRYLATLAPIVGLAAIAGLDAIAKGSDARRRGVTIFAGGATLHALLFSGLPSAWFPHVPTEFLSPVFEMFVPVVRSGLAPHNAGSHFFKVDAMVGMIPFFLAAIAIAIIAFRGDEKRPVSIAAHTVGVFAVFLALLAPLAAAAKYHDMGVTRFVRGIWDPRPRHEVRAYPPGPPREPRETTVQRGRAIDEAGDPTGALETYRRAAR